MEWEGVRFIVSPLSEPKLATILSKQAHSFFFFFFLIFFFLPFNLFWISIFGSVTVTLDYKKLFFGMYNMPIRYPFSNHNLKIIAGYSSLTILKDGDDYKIYAYQESDYHLVNFWSFYRFFTISLNFLLGYLVGGWS